MLYIWCFSPALYYNTTLSFLELRCPSWHYFDFLCSTLPFLTIFCPVLSYFVLDITLSLLVVLYSWYYFVFLGTALSSVHYLVLGTTFSFLILLCPTWYYCVLLDTALSFLALCCPSWFLLYSFAFSFALLLPLRFFSLFFPNVFSGLLALCNTLSLLIYFSIHKVIFLSASTPILLNTIHYSL